MALLLRSFWVDPEGAEHLFAHGVSGVWVVPLHADDDGDDGDVMDVDAHPVGRHSDAGCGVGPG